MQAVFPAYIALMNQMADGRYQAASVKLVALFPHFKKKHKKAKRKTHQSWSVMRVHHHCTSILMAPLKRYRSTGLYARLSDDTIIWLCLFLAYVNTDNEENDAQATVKRGGTTFHPSRSTLMSRELIGEVVRLEEQYGSRFVVVNWLACHKQYITHNKAYVNNNPSHMYKYMNDNTHKRRNKWKLCQSLQYISV